MHIRFATKNDIPGIVECYNEWVHFKGILPVEFTQEVEHDTISKSMELGVFKYVVADIYGVIGGVFYIDTSFQTLFSLRLGNLIIKEKYRRKGIATSFIKFVENYANQNKASKIWLWTQKELSSAISCYQKNGFILEGEQKKQFCGKDALLFGKIL